MLEPVHSSILGWWGRGETKTTLEQHWVFEIVTPVIWKCWVITSVSQNPPQTIAYNQVLLQSFYDINIEIKKGFALFTPNVCNHLPIKWRGYWFPSCPMWLSASLIIASSEVRQEKCEVEFPSIIKLIINRSIKEETNI